MLFVNDENQHGLKNHRSCVLLPRYMFMLDLLSTILKEQKNILCSVISEADAKISFRGWCMRVAVK